MPVAKIGRPKHGHMSQALQDAMRAALRAWVRADAEGMAGEERTRRLQDARRLTGIAVNHGLLKGTEDGRGTTQ